MAGRVLGPAGLLRGKGAGEGGPNRRRTGDRLSYGLGACGRDDGAVARNGLRHRRSISLICPSRTHAAPCAARAPIAFDWAAGVSHGVVGLGGAVLAPPAAAVGEGAGARAGREGVADRGRDGRVGGERGRVGGASGPDAVVQLGRVRAEGLGRGRGCLEVGGEAGGLAVIVRRCDGFGLRCGRFVGDGTVLGGGLGFACICDERRDGRTTRRYGLTAHLAAPPLPQPFGPKPPQPPPRPPKPQSPLPGPQLPGGLATATAPWTMAAATMVAFILRVLVEIMCLYMRVSSVVFRFVTFVLRR